MLHDRYLKGSWLCLCKLCFKMKDCIVSFILHWNLFSKWLWKIESHCCRQYKFPVTDSMWYVIYLYVHVMDFQEQFIYIHLWHFFSINYKQILKIIFYIQLLERGRDNSSIKIILIRQRSHPQMFLPVM